MHCGKAFTSSNDIEMHERLNTGEKPCVCSEYRNGFFSLTVVEKHEKIHS
jgi:KRAB domain-containing zinc finger protein